MGAYYPHQMKVVWLIGEQGAVKPPIKFRSITPANLYRLVEPRFRYAVCLDISLNRWDDEQLLVMDFYNSSVTATHPFVDPHWIEGFAHMDHAVAALTLTYSISADARREFMQRQSVLRVTLNKEDEKMFGLHFDDLTN